MYGKLTDVGIKYLRNARMLSLPDKVILNPSIAQLNEAGYYEIETIEDDGENRIENGKLLRYIGKPKPIEEGTDVVL